MNKQIIGALSLILNGSMNKYSHVNIPYSSTTFRYTKALYLEGLILSFGVLQDFNKKKAYIRIALRNHKGVILTSALKIISKPTAHRYLTYKEICRLTLHKTVCFFSTDKGLFTLAECKKYKIGGILVCYV